MKASFKELLLEDQKKETQTNSDISNNCHIEKMCSMHVNTCLGDLKSRGSHSQTEYTPLLAAKIFRLSIETLDPPNRL